MGNAQDQLARWSKRGGRCPTSREGKATALPKNLSGNPRGGADRRPCGPAHRPYPLHALSSSPIAPLLAPPPPCQDTTWSPPASTEGSQTGSRESHYARP